jgi:tRNA dimethylallyltransferase
MVSSGAVSSSGQEPPVIFIAGPTASGKTELGMRLADRLDVALINVDAAQVYKGMDIGTAKLDATSRERYPHALIDIRDPSEVYDASRFVEDATALINQAHLAGKIPVLVGGSLFYFSALEKGVSKLPPANSDIRLAIEREATELGWKALYECLQAIDPVICRSINTGDKQRIQRALEIYQLTGAPPSQVMAASEPRPLDHRIFKFNLFTPDRHLLHTRINQRFSVMLSSGLIEEVAALKEREDLHLNLPSMRCVGYRQVWLYLAGEIDYATMKSRGEAATRQLAKRQLTWLRHQRGQIWLSSEFERNVELILPFLQ